MKFRIFCLALFISIACISAKAQTIAGSWRGSVPAGGIKLRLVINIVKTGNQYSATFDSPDQKAFGIPCSKITVAGDSVLIEIAVINGSYKGLWNGKDDITGTYSQSGGHLGMDIHRVDPLAALAPAPVVVKPQTPKPPFNYYSQDVEYDNADKSQHFGATFTRPKGTGKYPTVIIITGSGTQDRDGSLFGHKLYWVLADYLTRNGIAVLRVDDRGAGKSTLGKDIMSATSLSFSYDVEASLNYLETRADVDKKHLGLIGHSEGAAIAPMVAVRRKDVAFIVLWGCPAIGGAQTSIDQIDYALQKQGKTPAAINAWDELQMKAYGLFPESKTQEDFDQKLAQIVTEWKKEQSPDILVSLGATGPDSEAMQNYDKIYSNAWMRYFIAYKPVTDISKVTCPVLAVIGTKDTQVDAAKNLPLIKSTLTKAGNKNFETIALPNLNHFLQTAITGDATEYGEIAETMSPLALKTIGNWVKAHSK